VIVFVPVNGLKTSGLDGVLTNNMANPRVADGGDGLQMWRIAANILDKQSWTDDKG